MADETERKPEDGAPADADKRAALKKLGRYAAYTAPATLVAIGYASAQGTNGSGVSPPTSPPPTASPPTTSPPTTSPPTVSPPTLLPPTLLPPS